MNISIFLVCFLPLVYSEKSTNETKKSANEDKFATKESRLARSSDQQIQSGIDHNFKIFHPPVYDYRQTQNQQRDHLKHRYVQQQQSDLLNMAKILHKSLSNGRTYSPEVNPQSTIMKILQESEEIQEGKPTQSVAKENLNDQTVDKNRRRIRIIRKPKQGKNSEEDLQAEGSQIRNETVQFGIHREDSEGYQQVIYVQPNFLKQNFGLDPKSAQQILHNAHSASSTNQDHELAALSDLIGKNPKMQLEGLKNLLQSSNNLNNYEIPIADESSDKDHIPITEKIVDIPNLQSKPNVRVQYQDEHKNDQANLPIMMHSLKNPLQAIQAQLDDASKLNAERVLAKATQDALAHVEAQHKAIAAVKAKAEQEALAKVALANSLPQALPLTSALPLSVIPMQTPAPSEVQTVPLPHQEVAIQTSLKVQPKTVKPEIIHHEQKVYYQTVPHKFVFALAAPQILSSPHNNHYAPSRSQVVKILEAEKEALANAKAHSDAFFQAQLQKDVKSRQNDLNQLKLNKVNVPDQDQANALQKTVVKTKRKFSYQPALENKLVSKDLQYASKYAFGYRIKDFKMGNDFGHEEKREGHSAKGHYHVLLPDGRLQKVEYYADDNGYHAKVTYEKLESH